jgi:type VI secretion system protein ImpD
VDAPLAADGGIDDITENGGENTAENLKHVVKAQYDFAVGTFQFDRPRRRSLDSNSATQADLVAWIDRLIAAIDAAISAQVNAILHHPRLQALEARWRGLAYLVQVLQDVPSAKLKVLPVSWGELCRDLDRAVEFDQSRLFRLVYSDEFDMPGGEPFGLMVGDYAVVHRPTPACPTDDVAALHGIAAIAAAAFCPFVMSCGPSLLGLDHFEDLDLLPDLAPSHQGPDFARWRGLRSLADARFLGIVLPRVLMRLPYRRHDRSRIDGFTFQEDVTGAGREFLWGNAVFAFAGVVLRAYARSGWFADLRGAPEDAEGGGLVSDLPTLSFSTDRPGVAVQPPVEIRLTSAQERMISELGLIPIVPLPYTPYLVFNTNSSLHQPPAYDRPSATQNARLSAMLQYVLCASRLAHHMKGKMRDQIGRLVNASALEKLLSDWLSQYCLGNDDAGAEIKARFPLRAAQVRVFEIAGRPGVLKCMLHLQPHFQLDDVAATFHLVAEIATVAAS